MRRQDFTPLNYRCCIGWVEFIHHNTARHDNRPKFQSSLMCEIKTGRNSTQVQSGTDRWLGGYDYGVTCRASSIIGGAGACCSSLLISACSVDALCQAGAWRLDAQQGTRAGLAGVRTRCGAWICGWAFVAWQGCRAAHLPFSERVWALIRQRLAAHEPQQRTNRSGALHIYFTPRSAHLFRRSAQNIITIKLSNQAPTKLSNYIKNFFLKKKKQPP